MDEPPLNPGEDLFQNEEERRRKDEYGERIRLGVPIFTNYHRQENDLEYERFILREMEQGNCREELIDEKDDGRYNNNWSLCINQTLAHDPREPIAPAITNPCMFCRVLFISWWIG